MKFSWFWNPLFLLCSALPSQAGEVDPLESWQREVLKAVREEAISPNLAVRNFAILNGAVFDALNSIDARWKPYHFDERPEEKNLLPELIVSGTCHTIAINLHPSRKGAFGHLLESHKKEFSGNAPVESSLSLGKRAAHSFLKLRESDGASTTLTYYPRLETGQWRRTPPRQRPPEQPHWRKVKPFCLPNLKEFLPIPPPSLGSPQYVTAVKEVKMLGAKKSTLRTSEQTLIAKFWKDFSYTATPPGHWNEIAGFVARSRKLSLIEKARLFALLNYALADAGIVAWESKFRYHLWRPIHAIRLAGQIQATTSLARKNWVSLLEPPPHPEYVSGHSCYSGTAARLLANFFGTDKVSFLARSDGMPGVTRKFSSFRECAEEIGMSRLYGGIHYSFSNRNGLDAGKEIADYVSDNLLRPVN